MQQHLWLGQQCQERDQLLVGLVSPSVHLPSAPVVLTAVVLVTAVDSANKRLVAREEHGERAAEAGDLGINAPARWAHEVVVRPPHVVSAVDESHLKPVSLHQLLLDLSQIEAGPAVVLGRGGAD